MTNTFGASNCSLNRCIPAYESMGDESYGSEDEVFFGPVTAKERHKSTLLLTPTRQRTAVYFPGTSTPKSLLNVYEKRTPTGSLLFSVEASKDHSSARAEQPAADESSRQAGVSQASSCRAKTVLKPSRLFENWSGRGLQSGSSDSGFGSVDDVDEKKVSSCSDLGSFTTSPLSRSSITTFPLPRSITTSPLPRSITTSPLPPSITTSPLSRSITTSPLPGAGILLDDRDPRLTRSGSKKKEKEGHSALMFDGFVSPGYLETSLCLVQRGVVAPCNMKLLAAVVEGEASGKENKVPTDRQRKKKEIGAKIITPDCSYHANLKLPVSPSISQRINTKKESPVDKPPVIFKDFPTVYGKPNIGLRNLSSGHDTTVARLSSVKARKVASCLSSVMYDQDVIVNNPDGDKVADQLSAICGQDVKHPDDGIKLVFDDAKEKCAVNFTATDHSSSSLSHERVSSTKSAFLRFVGDKSIEKKGPKEENNEHSVSALSKFSPLIGPNHTGVNYVSAQSSAQLSVQKAQPVEAEWNFKNPVSQSEEGSFPSASKPPFEHPIKDNPAIVVTKPFFEHPIKENPAIAVTKPYFEHPIKENPVIAVTKPREVLVKYFSPIPADDGEMMEWEQNAVSDQAKSAWDLCDVQPVIPSSTVPLPPLLSPALSVLSSPPLLSSPSDLVGILNATQKDVRFNSGEGQRCLFESLAETHSMHDWMTRVHTESNSIVYHTVLDPSSSPAFMQEFPPDREATKVRWSDQLTEGPTDVTPAMCVAMNTAPRSILMQRPLNYVFPFSTDPPTPIVITRRRRDLLVRPALNKLRRLMFSDSAENDDHEDVDSKSPDGDVKTTAL